MGKYAIFIVSALIFSMLTYSSALRNALFQSNFRNLESFSQLQALNIANSAALVAINDIRNDSDSDFAPAAGETYSYPSSTGFTDWGDLAGSYNLQVTNQADTLLALQSTGRFETHDYRVNVGLTKGGTSEWLAVSVDKAIHSESKINLNGGTVKGDLSLNKANSEFLGKSGAQVDGSLYFYDESPVPDDDLENYDGSFNDPDGNSEDYNQTYQMDEKFTHTNPSFPEFTVAGINSYNGGNNEIIDFSSYPYGIHFDSFSTRSGTTIDTGVEGDVTKIYTNTLDLSKGLTLSGEGSVSLYVSESLQLTGGNINSTAETPKNLTIYYKGTSDVRYEGSGSFKGLLFSGNTEAGINIGGNVDFTGHIISFGDEVTLNGNPDNASLVYAPSAKVTLNGTAGSFRGAIVSDEFLNNGTPTIEYDSNFASLLPDLEQEANNQYVIVYWN